MHSSKRTILLFIGIPLGLLVLVFLGMVGWFTWQLSHGDRDTVRNIIETFDAETFSAIAANSRSSNQVENSEQYIRSHNPRFGNPTADITIIAFIDFECPYCRRAYSSFESIRERYEPVVQVVFKHFPLESIHPNAGTAAIAAQCAEEQNAFWPFYREIFTEQQLSSNAYTSYANKLSLNISQFETCQSAPKMKRTVEQDLQDGINIGVRGTPTYMVNGTIVEGIISEEQWDAIIIELLNQSS